MHALRGQFHHARRRSLSTPLTDLSTIAALAVLDDPEQQQRFTRYSLGPDGQRSADTALRISGTHCAACAGLIEQALRQVSGVQTVQVSADGTRAQVRWLTAGTRLTDIVTAIRQAGYDAVPDAARAAREQRTLEGRLALWRLFVAAFCAMQVMMLATPSYLAAGNALAPDLRQLLNWGSWLLSLPVLVFSAGPYFAGAWASLRQRRIGMDVPVALGLAVTFVASSGATFAPQGVFGAEAYFDSLTMFVAFLLTGRWLETRARHRVAQVLEQAQARMPATAQRLDAAGLAHEVSVQRLLPGDSVRVPVGQAFAADGVLVQGQTQADEALLTGESAPVDKPAGAAVVGGSINLGAPVLMLVTRVGADTRAEAIASLMRDAALQRPSLARAADRWAGPFLWTVLLLAAAAAAVWSLIDPTRAVWVAVAVLIVTCPCALSLAAPSALLAAASALARRGVLLRRLDALEALSTVRRVYLDKTGTVTDALSQVAVMRPLSDAGVADAARWSAPELQAIAASLALWSSHPLAQAVAALATRPAVGPGPARPEPTADWTAVWTELSEQPGRGVQARAADGQVWRLGALAYVRQGGASGAGATGGSAAPQPEPATHGAEVWLGCAGLPLACFDIDQPLRPDAQAAVAALQALGMEVVLLSGDSPERARHMAARLGLAHWVGGATPEAKLAEVAQAQAGGARVLVVGDGLNDAPVLALADVSIAMGQGALLAQAQADAVLVSGRLNDIAGAIATSRRAMRVVRQNIVWAVAYNAACVPLALLGVLPPWAAGLGMAASSLLVMANALRLAR